MGFYSTSKSNLPFLCTAATKAATLFCDSVKQALVILIVGLRSLFGPARCQFEIGCTQFAVTRLETEPLPIAIKSIVFRLMVCNPLVYFFRKK